MNARIFLADDERPVLDGVAAAIRKRLPDVVICGTASTGREAIDGAIRERPDVILMDVRMPGMSGLEGLRELRASAPETVPILLTAYERFDVAKEAFGLGVYDYLVKPFSPRELLARIKAIIKRSAPAQAAPGNQVSFEGLAIDFDAHNVYVDGGLVSLTPKEYELLSWFARHPNRVFSREQLLEQVWGYDFPGQDRTVDTLSLIHIPSPRDRG